VLVRIHAKRTADAANLRDIDVEKMALHIHSLRPVMC
jgi:hypothetical protein